MSTGIALPRQHGVDRRIFRAAASVLLAGAIVKVAGACREFVVAGIYGRSDAMDAFLVAFLIPNLLVNLIADSMNQALIPTWIRVSIREGRERAQRLLSNSILALCALLTAVSLIMAALARLTFPLIGSGFALVKLDLSIHLFYGLLPVVFMTGIASSCTAILNACERFAVPALAQLVMPVTIVAGALLLEPRLGIWALVYATVLGSFLHASLVAGMMHARGFRIQLLSKAKGMSGHPERSAAGRAVEGSAVVFFLRSRISVLQESIISRLKASRAVLKAHDLGVWGKIRITTCLVPVHDFSRAATGAKRVRALSPEGYGYRPQSADRHSQYSDENTRTVVRQFGPLLLSSLVASGGLLVDQAMAAMLPSGSVSALVFATRFVSVVVTLMAGAVSSALAPYFSMMVAEQDWNGCRRALGTWSRGLAGASVPVALLLIVGARPLVRITLQHGAFHSQDTAEVSPVLAMYAIQIPFFVVSRVFYRFIVAMRRTDLILYCGVLNLVLDVALNLLLMRSLGVAGIALSTSLWSISTFVFLLYWARRLIGTAGAPRGEACA